MLLGCSPSGGGGGGGGVTITSSRNHTMHSTAPFARMEHHVAADGLVRRSCAVSSGCLDVSECDVSSASGVSK